MSGEDPLERLRRRAAAARETPGAPAGPPAADDSAAAADIPPAADIPGATPPAASDLPVAAPPAAEPPAPVVPVDEPPVAAAEVDEPRRRVPARAVLAAALVVAVAMAGAASALTVRLSDRHQVQQARLAIISAAVSAVKATASYSWQSLTADERAAETQLVEPLRSAYATRVAQQVNPLATKYHATAKASVDPKYGAGIVTQSRDGATVLLYVDQVVTNNQLSAPRLDQTRVLATMRRVGSRWLMSDLKTL